MKKILLLILIVFIAGCMQSKDFKYGIKQINQLNSKYKTTMETYPNNINEINLMIKDFKEIGYDSPDLISEAKTLNHLLFEDFKIPTIKIEIHKKYRLPKLHPTLFRNLSTALAQFLMLVGVH